MPAAKPRQPLTDEQRKLAEACVGLAKALGRRTYLMPWLSFEERESIALDALVKAAAFFREDGGASFATVVGIAVRTEFITEHRKTLANKRKTLRFAWQTKENVACESEDRLIEDNGHEREALTNRRREALIEMLDGPREAGATERGAEIVRQRLDGEKFDAIAARTAMSRTTTRTNYARTLAWLSATARHRFPELMESAQ